MKACITQPPPPPPLPVKRQASHFSTYTFLSAASLLAHYKRHQFFPHTVYSQQKPTTTTTYFTFYTKFQGNFIHALCVGRVVTVKKSFLEQQQQLLAYCMISICTYITNYILIILYFQSKQTDKIQTAIIITVGGKSNVAVKTYLHILDLTCMYERISPSFYEM